MPMFVREPESFRSPSPYPSVLPISSMRSTAGRPSETFPDEPGWKVQIRDCPSSSADVSGLPCESTPMTMTAPKPDIPSIEVT